MQRQSLGSPGSKLNIHGGTKSDVVLKGDDQKRRESFSPSASSSEIIADEDEMKLEKPLRSHHPRPEKFIHIIPILTLLCFLILYLCSHEPSQSQKALSRSDAFKHFLETVDSTDSDDIGRFVDKGEILAIGSLRNLQDESRVGRTELKCTGGWLLESSWSGPLMQLGCIGSWVSQLESATASADGYQVKTGSFLFIERNEQVNDGGFKTPEAGFGELGQLAGEVNRAKHGNFPLEGTEEFHYAITGMCRITP
ncbi:hypothetical protein Ancab_015768 [Ancistrocladus abbreviatus]